MKYDNKYVLPYLNIKFYLYWIHCKPNYRSIFFYLYSRKSKVGETWHAIKVRATYSWVRSPEGSQQILYNMSLNFSAKNMACRGKNKDLLVLYVTMLSSLYSISYKTNIMHIPTSVSWVSEWVSEWVINANSSTD